MFLLELAALERSLPIFLRDRASCPPGIPPAGGDFQRAQGLLFSAVTTEDWVLFGFGIEQIESAAEGAAVLGKAMEHLLPSTG
jgi:hypothetical protein